MSDLNSWKKKRNLLLCVTGGIAAYKIPNLVRLLKKSDLEIEILLTKSAEKFVSPLVLSTLSGKKVWLNEDFFSDESGFKIPHINLARNSEIIVIAPCTANTIAKIAHGFSDDLLSATVLAKNENSKVLIFPAMNENMLENPLTQENLKILSEKGFSIIEPNNGDLACGVSGKGRMPEPQEILQEIFRALSPVHDMIGKRVLVTAGATHEYIDPVRFISNPSSGKMGVSIARAAWYRGAEIKLILGASNNDLNLYGFQVEKVSSTQNMLDAVMNNLEDSDIIVKAAAVGDYRAKEFQAKKIKRQNRDEIQITLIQNPDISFEVGKNKRDNQILIGFAAETDDLIKNAREKLSRKNLDYILANDVSAENSGFAVDTNTLRLIAKNPDIPEAIFSGLKEDISYEIWDCINKSC